MKKKSPWIKIEDPYDVPEGEEVIGYNPAWVDEDFNPNGTRVGFLLKLGLHQRNGTTHRIAMTLVQKKATIIIFFKKMLKGKSKLIGGKAAKTSSVFVQTFQHTLC